MVQILPPKTNLGTELGRSIGQGAQTGLERGFQQGITRGQLREGLSQLENLTPEQRANPLSLLSSVLNATAGIPGSERYVGPVYEALLKQQGVTASQNVAPPGSGNIPGRGQGKAGVQSFKEQAPSFANQQPQGTTNQKTPEAESALRPNPKPESAEVVRPRRSTELVPPQQLLTPQEMQAEAQRIAQEKTSQGVPTRWEDVMPSVEAENVRRQAYNQQIQQDNKNILNYRNDVESGARTAYKNYVGSNFSEKDANRFVKWALEAEDATSPERFDYARRKFDQLQAARSAVRQQPSRPNWLKDIARKVEGSDRSLDQSINELHGIVKPLIDMGEFQEARDLLINDIGLGLDETERVIHPMDKEQLKTIDSIPEGKTTKLSPGKFLREKGGLAGIGAQEFVRQPKNIETLKKEIPVLLEKYPDLDLIQVRNKLAKRNYDWREFSEAVQELDKEGKLNLNQDARNNIQYLYNPPVKGFMNIFKNWIFGKE